MEFGKRQNTTDTTDFSHANFYGLVVDFLQRNWCNGNAFWPSLSIIRHFCSGWYTLACRSTCAGDWRQSSLLEDGVSVSNIET